MRALLLAFIALFLVEGSRQQRIIITEPRHGARIYNQEPLKVAYETEGIQMPQDGVLRILGNGKDLGVTLTALRSTLQISALSDGAHEIVIVLVSTSNESVLNATSRFIKRTVPPLMKLAKGQYSVKPVTLDSAFLGEWKQFAHDASEKDRIAATLNDGDVKKIVARLHRRAETVPEIGRRRLKEYDLFHQRGVSDPASSRFLIVRSSEVGLGNQIESLTSSFLFAILTHRVILIDNPVIENIISPPIEWSFQRIFDRLGGENISDEADIINLQWQNPEQFPDLLCEDLNSRFKSRFLFIFSDQYYLPALAHNPNYAAQIDTLFGGDAFGIISRHFLLPSIRAAKVVSTFMSTKIRKSHFVGVQIRTASMSKYDADFMAWDDFAWNDMPSAFFKCGILAGKASGLQNPIYFIASDNLRVKELALSSGINPSFIQFVNHSISRDHLDGHFNAYVDIVILSLADEIVTTSMSTFGYVASGMASVVPHVMTYQAACLRELSSQPCFHKSNFLHGAKCYDKIKMTDVDMRFCGPLSPAQMLADAVW